MKIKRFILFYILACFVNFSFAQNNKFELSLKVLNGETENPLENASILIQPCDCGGISNRDGTFSIVLDSNTYQVKVSFIGFKESIQKIELDKDSFLEILLFKKQEQLSEVIVNAKKINDNLQLPQMGALSVKTEDLKKIPVALGEFDVLKGITLLAGVNNAGEVSNGVSVRGGSLDQNLILYDNAPVFNPTHLFGLFSVFTPDMISSLDLYRANVPARYGGRTASVLDIKVKDPYTEKFKLTGGIGLVSSRIALETPVVKDKLMLSAGVRAGFTDFLLPLFSKRLKNTKARFYDGTIKLLYLPTEKDQIAFTGFYSKDFYQLDLITKIENVNAENNQYDFQTINGTINWLHTFNNKTNLRTILVGSNYKPKTIFPEFDSDNEIEFESRINYLSLISEISKNVTDSFDYYAGVQANQYVINPGMLNPGSGNNVNPITLTKETSYELSTFANINWEPISNLSLSVGIRYNQFLFQGPFTLAIYDENGSNVIETEFFEKGEKVKTYSGLAPRMGASLRLGKTMSIKASYARLNQYLQNVYNNTTPLPTSRWKTSDPNILPQSSDAYGIGFYKNFNNNKIEVGVEGYYRDIKNVLTYKPGADFFLEEFLERDVVQGKGKAYGVELSFKKPKGKINGWFNYTWSRSFMRTQNESLSDRINNNNWYASDFDRPHVVNGTINFEGDKYNTFSFNFTGQTGRPYTVPSAVLPRNDINVAIFLERNNARLRTYHRLDLSWKIKYSKKLNRNWVGDWTFTVYNIYDRTNPFNRYYTQRDRTQNSTIFRDSPLGSYELSVLNSPLFSLTYNFTFE